MMNLIFWLLIGVAIPIQTLASTNGGTGCHGAQSAQWYTSTWSSCSAVCGGTQTRIVQCRNPGGQTKPDDKCNCVPKPSTVQTCTTTNTQTDIQNCGVCNHICSVAHGTPGCSAGACTVASCDAGFANCDNNVANGCEFNTQSDPDNCGGCNNVCPTGANGERGCSNGVCTGACNPGFANCDNDPSNGCETNTQTSNSNCGSCGNACSVVGTVCSGGVCVCGVNEKLLSGACYYLDGSTGLCDPGYVLGSQSVLSNGIFEGLNYKHTVSDNCCIWNSDANENFGMQSCNDPGPFTSGDPTAGAAGCTDQFNHYDGQLTLCKRVL